jgi:hypothetical protein
MIRLLAGTWTLQTQMQEEQEQEQIVSPECINVCYRFLYLQSFPVIQL